MEFIKALIPNTSKIKTKLMGLNEFLTRIFKFFEFSRHTQSWKRINWRTQVLHQEPWDIK